MYKDYHVNIYFYRLLRKNNYGEDYRLQNYLCTGATDEFYLYLAGGDSNVIASILDREERLINSDFDLIIGLRDMFSDEYDDEYKKVFPGKSISVNCDLIKQLLENVKSLLTNKAKNPNKIKLVYSIMEIECWLLGMHQFLIKVDSKLTSQYIQEKLNINLYNAQPEIDFLHPSQTLNKIYNLVGKSYTKHISDFETIISKLDKDDFEILYHYVNCKSFKKFYNLINFI